MASNNACCAVFLTSRPGQVGNLRGDGARNLEIVDGAGGFVNYVQKDSGACGRTRGWIYKAAQGRHGGMFPNHIPDSAPGYQQRPHESSPLSTSPSKPCCRLTKLSLRRLGCPSSRPSILLYHPIQPCRKPQGSTLLPTPSLKLTSSQSSIYQTSRFPETSCVEAAVEELGGEKRET